MSTRAQTELIPRLAPDVPHVFLTSSQTFNRFCEFFTANIRNPNTRRSYFNATRRFSDWCRIRDLELTSIRPIHVAAYIEELTVSHARPTVKQNLAALRMLFDWFVTGGLLAMNPASSVRGPKHSQRRGKTPVLAADEMALLLKSIQPLDLIGLRDRALISLMAYTFARVGAVLTLRGADYYIQARRGWIRLQEKGGKVIEMPCHHNLEQYLDEWLSASGLQSDDPLFPTFRNGLLTRHPLAQSNVFSLVRKRAAAAGILTPINCHSFRATGITTYLQNGGRLEIAQQMAGHESARTTGLYDRRNDILALDEVERITYG